MSSATYGRAAEYAVRDHLISHGWSHIMRASGSRGAADLLMAHAYWGGALIQVGRVSKTLGPADRDRLCNAAELISALPLLAIVTPRQPIRIWRVDRGKPASWSTFDTKENAA